MRLRILLPDELAYGYVTAVCHDNVIASKDELAALLGVPENARARDSIELPAALLQSLELSGQALVRQHSLVPVAMSVRRFDARAAVLPHFGEARYLRVALWPGQTPRLCQDCVSEDLSYWGASYYRRSHQLRGVIWCIKHQRPLSVTQAQPVLWSRPHHALASAVEIKGADVELATSSAVVGRYASILESLLDNAEGPIHSTRAASVIRKKVEANGLRVTTQGNTPYLSDAAREQLPKGWLSEFFPASQHKRPLEFARWIDLTGQAKAGVSSYAFALALALLWDNPDDAVRSFLGANRSVSLVARAKPYRPPLDGRTMRELWLRFEGKHKRIASELGMDLAYVSRMFHFEGLHPLGSTSMARLQSAAGRFLAGDSLVRASASLGVKVEHVETFMRASLRQAASVEPATEVLD